MLGAQLDPLWFEYQSNQESHQEIEELLRTLAMQHLGWSPAGSRMLLPPPPQSKSRGSYDLGIVLYAGKEVGTFGLREQEWIQHVAIFGRSGSGKTNVGFLVLRELLRHGKPVWVFDWKRNYRDAASNLGLSVLTVGREVRPFSFNPLEPPPGTERDIWIKKLVEILAHVYGFRGATSYLLQRALYGLCRTEGSGFTFDDVRQHLEQLKPSGREGQWLQSARRVIGTLCFGPIANVLTGNSISLQELLERSVIFELDALTDADKTFIIEALLLWVHQYRMQQPGREHFRHAMLIEEAHHILLKHRQSRETVTDVILREIRELGESVILIDQHPSLVSQPSLGNTYTTIAMNLKHGSDVAALGNAMQLDSEARDGLGKLLVGSAIVRLQGRWPRPFLVKFPEYEVAKGSVTDHLLESNPNYSARSAGIRADEATERKIRVLRQSDEGATLERDAPAKTESYCRFLADIASFLLSGVAERYRRLGLSAAAGTELKETVLRRGWVKAGRIRLGKRSLVVLTLTTSGLQVLRQSGWNGEYATPDDHAGPEHEFWKAWLFSELRNRDIEVQAEYLLPNGHRVDLFIHPDIAIEVETGTSNFQSKVTLLHGVGLQRLLVVVTSPEARRKIASITDLQPARLVVEAHHLPQRLESVLSDLALRPTASSPMAGGSQHTNIAARR